MPGYHTTDIPSDQLTPSKPLSFSPAAPAQQRAAPTGQQLLGFSPSAPPPSVPPLSASQLGLARAPAQHALTANTTSEHWVQGVRDAFSAVDPATKSVVLDTTPRSQGGSPRPDLGKLMVNGDAEQAASRTKSVKWYAGAGKGSMQKGLEGVQLLVEPPAWNGGSNYTSGFAMIDGKQAPFGNIGGQKQSVNIGFQLERPAGPGGARRRNRYGSGPAGPLRGGGATTSAARMSQIAPRRPISAKERELIYPPGSAADGGWAKPEQQRDLVGAMTLQGQAWESLRPGTGGGTARSRPQSVRPLSASVPRPDSRTRREDAAVLRPRGAGRPAPQLWTRGRQTPSPSPSPAAAHQREWQRRVGEGTIRHSLEAVESEQPEKPRVAEARVTAQLTPRVRPGTAPSERPQSARVRARGAPSSSRQRFAPRGTESARSSGRASARPQSARFHRPPVVV